MQGFGFALFAIQAPLLGPRAFGLITLVMIFVGFCEHVLEVASTDALISVREIDARHYSTMTATNAVLSTGLGLGVFILAHRIAVEFREPELEQILRCMAVLPLISALATAPNAASRRDMHFRPLAIRVIVSVIAGGATGLALTFLHFGVWALVWQAIVQRAVNVGVLWGIVAIPFRLGFSRPHFLELWRYGGPMLLSQSLSWGAGQIPRFILGLYLTASELGLFSLAARTSEIVLMVAISPAFGVARVQFRAYFEDAAGLREAVQRQLRHTAVLAFPLCAGGAAVMPVLFRVWLDSRWNEGVPAAQCMLLGVMPYVTHYGLSAALLAMNQQSKIAANSAVQSMTTVVVTILFAPFGLNPATAAIAARPLVTAVVPMAFARREIGLAMGAVLRAQAPVLGATVTMAALVLGLEYVLAGRMNDLPLLALLVAAGATAYALLIRSLMPELAAGFIDGLRRRFRPGASGG